MLCAGAEGGEQRPGVEKPAVVWVILDAQKVEPCAVGNLGQVICQLQIVCRWVDVQTEKGSILLLFCHLLVPV